MKPGESITSWCAKKLEEAGALNLGKLSMHEFGLGGSISLKWNRCTFMKAS